jgi:hypothetical protein
MPAATLRILARNFESDAFNRDRLDFVTPLKIQLSDFSVEYLAQGGPQRLRYVRQFFPEAVFGECFIEREYQSIPPLARDYVGFGAVPEEPEDLLSSLRLYRAGDLAFVGVSIEKTGHGPAFLYPYRVISNLATESTRQFTFNREDVQRWEAFDLTLRSSPSWRAGWFKVARRAFLYGSSDEFNPNHQGTHDRVSYFFAALEASLVPRSDLIIRCLKERSIALLDLKGDEVATTKKLLNEFYGIRSTLVHGSPLSTRQVSLLQDRDRWWEFEQLVRNLLVAAVKKVPPDDVSRRAYLSGLYELDDAARADEVVRNFNAIKDDSVRESLIDTLTSATSTKFLSRFRVLRALVRRLARW